MEKIANYINGELSAPHAGRYIENFEPATGKVFALIPDSDTQDVLAAVKAAKEAFPKWQATLAQERCRLMLKIADGLEAQLQTLAEIESTDNGKPVALAAKVDIPRAVENFRFFATAILHTSTEAHATDLRALNYTRRSPLGVVGCISPWNLPLYLFTWKIAPALATGNCVVAKPSELTPMTAHKLAQICIAAGLPPGVLNIIHGTGPKAGEPMVNHPDVVAISFTGGTQTGATISRIAAPQFKKLSLELGGKNPTIVFADYKKDDLINETVRASFFNQGEICLAGSRVFVEASCYEEFKRQFVEKVQALKVGDPRLPQTDQGALVSKAHWEKVNSYIELAKKEGGKILCGGKPPIIEGRCSQGWFMQPTVIEGLPSNCRTNQEEIFGPVVTLIPFKNESEVIEYANSVVYGLAASIWTENLDRAHRLADQIKAGVVWINCWLLRDLRTPFGGMKSSGVGREGGLEALKFFTETKNVCIRLT
jgi:aminomuconate-semialdehyde/2-hydroxymuconate-6-semialdehyde dehydrogenase